MHDALTTPEILSAFSAEIAARRGTVTDTFDDGTRLFVRSTLPLEAEARPGDKLLGGVALRAAAGQISLHPYLFRLVCKNGAITATTIGSTRFENAGTPDTITAAIRHAVITCSTPETFTATMRDIRTAGDHNVDMVLNLMRFMNTHHASGIIRKHMVQIIDRYFKDNDQSQFGFMNAVTSVARDTPDPEARWTLEEFGGTIPAMTLTPRPQKPATRRLLEPVG